MSIKSNTKESPLKALFKDLVGIRIIIPRIEKLSPSWPIRKHPDLELIRDDFNSWVDLYVKLLPVQSRS